MKIWLRRSIGVLTLGGSAVGLAAIVSEVPITQLQGLSLVIVSMFAAFFIYGLVIGVLIIENSENSLVLALPFWLVQIPAITTPWISYALFTGAKFDILFQPNLDINFEWAGGARFNFYLFPDASMAIGANVLAVLISYLIWTHRERAT